MGVTIRDFRTRRVVARSRLKVETKQAKYSKTREHRLEFYLSPRRYTISLEAPGYRTIERTIEVSREGRERITVFLELTRSQAPLFLQRFIGGKSKGIVSTSLARSTAHLDLEEIKVIEDGPVRDTPWGFRIFVDGFEAFEVPVRLYDDDDNPPTYSMSTEHHAATILSLTKREIKVEIIGYRGPPIVGEREIETGTDQTGVAVVQVPVRASNPKNGDFVLELSVDRAPRHGARSTRRSLTVSLDRVLVREHGSRDPTDWAFEVYANGKRMMSVSLRAYAGGIVEFSEEGLKVDIDKPADGVLALTVLGYRTPAVKGAGIFVLAPGTGEVTEQEITVQNPDDPRDGHFVFTLSVTTPAADAS